MRRTTVLIYGIVAYIFFAGTFLYAIGFVGDILVPRSVSESIDAPLGQALVVNALLLGLFGLQHSVMARPWFKRWWTKVVPAAAERSTFVFLTCVVLALIFWQWRSVGGVIWEVRDPAFRIVLWTVSGFGWIVVFLSTFIIDHFDLFGLRQVVLYFRGKKYSSPRYKESSFYKYVRHPLLLGFLVAFWSTPEMTVGHLIFATITTAYVLFAIQLEERDLIRAHGQAYVDYRRRVPMLIPFLRFVAGSKRSSRYSDGDRPGGSLSAADSTS